MISRPNYQQLLEPTFLPHLGPSPLSYCSSHKLVCGCAYWNMCLCMHVLIFVLAGHFWQILAATTISCMKGNAHNIDCRQEPEGNPGHPGTDGGPYRRLTWLYGVLKAFKSRELGVGDSEGHTHTCVGLRWRYSASSHTFLHIASIIKFLTLRGMSQAGHEYLQPVMRSAFSVLVQSTEQNICVCVHEYVCIMCTCMHAKVYV